MFEMETGLLFWSLVSFLFLFLFLLKVGLPPILKILREREQQVKESLEAAQKAQQAAVELTEKNKQEMAAVRQKAQQMIQQSMAQAEKAGEEVLRQAKEQAQRQLQDSRLAALQQQRKALAQVESQAAQLLALGMERLAGKILTPQDQQALTENILLNWEKQENGTPAGL